MTDYVRVCPRCGQVNPEYENVCAACQHFIGMEETVLAPANAACATSIPSADLVPAPQNPTQDSSVGESLTQRFVSTEPMLFLEVAKDNLLPVRPGWRLGQAHASSDAEAQLPARLVGVEFVHRYHCRFEHVLNRWYVTALNQQSFARDFTNPTQVNGRLLPPGERFALNDGDELRLSGVILRVRMLPN
ncbi:putative FHA domain-containing protein [Gammaproteobacteria bacterium]